MSEKVYAGMDLGQRFHQVAVVGKNMKALVAPFQVGRGRGGIQEIFERLRFLKRDPPVCTHRAVDVLCGDQVSVGLVLAAYSIRLYWSTELIW